MAGIDEFANRQYVRPATRPLPRKHAVIAIDVSGSMDEGLVNRLCSAVRHSPANFDLVVYCFDTRCKEWKNFRTNDQIPYSGGGTDLKCVVESVRKHHHRPDRVIVLTDGGFYYPSESLPNKDSWVFMIYEEDALDWGATNNFRAVQLERLLT